MSSLTTSCTETFEVDQNYCLPCIPLVAVYGAAYVPCLPISIIQLPETATFREDVLPADMLERLSEEGWDGDVEFYAILHRCVVFT